MKSLPEKEIFNQLESRLRRYTEMPDDDAWDKIAGALPGGESVPGWVWFDRLSALAVIGLLLLLVMNQKGSVTHESNSKRISGTAESISINKNKDSIANENSSLNSSSFLNGKNHNVAMADLSQDEGTITKGADPNKSIFSKDNNQKTIMPKSLQRKLDTPSSASKDKDLMQNVEGDKLAGIYKNKIDVAVISKSNTIAVTGNKPSNDLSNATTSANHEESDEVQLKTDNNHFDSGSSIDSVNNVLAKTKDSLEAERKKRVPKELRKEKKIFKSVLYFAATPTLAYYKLTPDMRDNVTVVGLKQTGIFNTNRLGFNLDAGYQRKLTERFEVYGGLSYYQQSQHITYYYESAEGSAISTSPSNDLTFTVNPVAQKREKSIDYAMKNVGISAGMFYLIKDGRLQHKLGGGLQYQKGLARQNADATYSNASSSYFNYLIAYRLEWRYKARTNFFIQPDVNHVIQSKEKLTAPFSAKPYRAGIGIGILYWF